MCMPSASSAIDPVSQPAIISTTIIPAVSATTQSVRRSCASCASPRKICSCAWAALVLECTRQLLFVMRDDAPATGAERNHIIGLHMHIGACHAELIYALKMIGRANH